MARWICPGRKSHLNRIGYAPSYDDTTDEEHEQIQCVTVDNQRPIEFHLIIAKRKSRSLGQTRMTSFWKNGFRSDS